MNWTILFMIFSSIGSSFSAMNFKFVTYLPQDYYDSSRKANVHRGLLLSYTPAKKYDFCRDLFSQNYTDKTREISRILEREPLITDGETSDQEDPQYSLIVARITGMGVHSPRGRREDLFLKCVGKYFGLQESIVYTVSTAFHPGLMYDIPEDGASFDSRRMTLKQYTGMSPEYVELERKVLETQYATVRQNISAVENESPEYMKLIENKDILSALSSWQQFLLCSSITLSPFFEKNRSKFPLSWPNYQKNAVNKNTPEYGKKRLTFVDSDYSAKGWEVDYIYCASSDGGVTDLSPVARNLLLTPAYENNYSMYALIEHQGSTFLAGYFKNVPLLINAHVPITDDPPPDFRPRR